LASPCDCSTQISGCGEPLSYASRQISTLTETWPGSSKAGDQNRQPVLATRKRRPCRHVESWPNGLIDYSDWGFVRALFISCKLNARV